MAFVSAAPIAYLADDLARFIDLPNCYRGQRIRFIPFDASVSKNDVVYFPFQTEKEVDDWIECAVSEWWDDETV